MLPFKYTCVVITIVTLKIQHLGAKRFLMLLVVFNKPYINCENARKMTNPTAETLARYDKTRTRWNNICVFVEQRQFAENNKILFYLIDKTVIKRGVII